MSTQTFNLSAGVLLGGCLLLAGCGGGSSDAPETVPVEGTITMDAQPLADAIVTFVGTKSTDRLRSVSGVTDENGWYSVDYSYSQSGAQPGSYIVSISTQRAEDLDENGDPIPPTPETVPNVYNTNSTLTAEVTPDQSEYNYELDSSQGEIIQASQDPGAGIGGE